MPIFDRFIHYEWAEYALELAVKQEHPRALQEWLVAKGLGKESARRTSNLLSRLWFDVNSSTSLLRTDALNLFSTVESTEHLALHWGMAITQFPLFRDTAKVMGRLGRLQGKFTKLEVLSRVLEKYSNQSTINRAAERVIQTMMEWSVITTVSRSIYSIDSSHSIFYPMLAEWLFRSLVITEPEKYWLLPDILSASEIFPFDLDAHMVLLYRSRHLTIERDSNGAEIVGMRAP
jgi:hypothetical protein